MVGVVRDARGGVQRPLGRRARAADRDAGKPLREPLWTPTRSDPHQPELDRLAERLLDDDPWGLALHDPYRWTT